MESHLHIEARGERAAAVRAGALHDIGDVVELYFFLALTIMSLECDDNEIERVGTHTCGPQAIRAHPHHINPL